MHINTYMFNIFMFFVMWYEWHNSWVASGECVFLVLDHPPYGVTKSTDRTKTSETHTKRQNKAKIFTKKYSQYNTMKMMSQSFRVVNYIVV